ncbi:MAG: ECF transporter S component [Ruminococcaceae bacterium]|nr:ECF transporter S component [Oscillospiraceae bacterium]
MRRYRKLVTAGLLLAIGLLLPFVTGQIKEIGDSLLPMHLPVMLCGLLCGWQYGALVGFSLPFVRSLLFGMPPIYPNAVWMACELFTYGLVIGLLYALRKRDSMPYLYACLIGSMLAGRAVWGVTKAALLGLSGKTFAFRAFLVGGFADALPGIVLQLILIPPLVRLIRKMIDKRDGT